MPFWYFRTGCWLKTSRSQGYPRTSKRSLQRLVPRIKAGQVHGGGPTRTRSVRRASGLLETRWWVRTDSGRPGVPVAMATCRSQSRPDRAGAPIIRNIGSHVDITSGRRGHQAKRRDQTANPSKMTKTCGLWWSRSARPCRGAVGARHEGNGWIPFVAVALAGGLPSYSD